MKSRHLFIKKSAQKIGMAPGTLVHIGEQRTEPVQFQLIQYDEHAVSENAPESIDSLVELFKKEGVSWLNLDGVHNVDVIETIGKQFNIHPLVLEDIVHTGQRPKVEDYHDYLFIILKMIYLKNDDIVSEQVSIILSKDSVMSFQEMPGDIFDPIRERIRNQKGRIRIMNNDYLAYALMDAIVDHYFVVLEFLGDQIEALEDELSKDPTPATLQKIHSLKRDLIYFRKSVWPFREVISVIERSESELVSKKIFPFLRDVYDHTIQVIETVETYRDILSGLLDTYLSSVSNRMNEVMQVLTIIATIFIPLTFIAGIYGMNFENMPELKWHFGYPMVWGVMGIVALGMLIYFKRKKWL